MRNKPPIRLLPVVTLLIGALVIFKLANYALDQAGPSGVAMAQETEQSDKDGEEAPLDEVLDPELSGELAAKSEPEAKPEVPQDLTAAEREVLESLFARRKQLDERQRLVQLRERLLEAAEKRVEQRIAELKAIEVRIEESFGKKEDQRKAQMQNVVSMYENMKPKEAARIFDKLDMTVLLGVVQQMKTRKMAPILAKMDSSVAQRLTVELARIAAVEPLQ